MQWLVLVVCVGLTACVAAPSPIRLPEPLPDAASRLGQVVRCYTASGALYGYFCQVGL